jgi:hypothetical protein
MEVQPISGTIIDKKGALQPAPGWEWKKPNDPANSEVQRIEGITVNDKGALMPAEGWDWANYKDPQDLKVVRAKANK